MSTTISMSARRAGLHHRREIERAQTCNLTPEQIAERRRVPSRQERRAAERRARKAKTMEYEEP